uniref:Costars family protein ABRACL n=1 Tax=Oncorhynchus mykiss TaxID=8022 RepID=A0A8C7VAM5_ONCMY
MELGGEALPLPCSVSGNNNVIDIHRNGQTSVKFGVLFNAYKCTNIFEALVVILRAAKIFLRAAKRKKIIAFEGELLLQGVHDNVDNHQLHSSIVILQGNG